ncbi:MAG: methyltetrahydrofolate cobalamin methyltransferase [Clostridiales bacterium]|jgi:5-methyltetrahydrofolate--homocysteine methyltransferase|nr:methyltetrahydrofolate cobalamin methyltransferase [Eubacteriales bacterium]MDH7566068.1 methyltetrahydrofolate cobalamin methyltransferase [Clostridiales bacterium]
MIIIGEKINGSIPSVGQAIERRDADFIRDLAKRQVDSGADYLDVCAGTSTDKEFEALCWLVDTVQEAVDIPLCVDSPNAHILKEVIPRIKRSGIINSVSGEDDKCEVIFPLMKGNDWQVIALTCDDKGIPAEAERKIEIAARLIEKAAEYGIGPERIYIDPLVLALSAVNDSMLSFMEAIREIKHRYPGVKTTSGLSNISFGMPYRKAINLNFLTLALSAGMDSAIIDPTNRDTYATILAAEALLNKDRFLRKYSKAYRLGRIGPEKKTQ